jgi:hypothetical protein
MQRQYWYTFYVLKAFLLMQISYRHVMDSLAGMVARHEERLLNRLWMSLLGLEFLMVVGVMLRGVVRVVKPRVKR